MINLSLQEVASALNADLIGKDVSFSGCSTDTRTIKKGELYIALHGPSFDGHDFIAAAEKAGAAAVMIDKSVRTNLPAIKVENTRSGIGSLASHWRNQFDIPVVGITGSNGKTTVKEMVSSILSGCGKVLSTKGNLNNDIGVPLTIFNLDQKHDYAVIEMGANHAGEIAYSSKIAKPIISVVTQCAPSHLEGFGSIEGVAHAKGEIFQSLPEKGTAIINADDDFAPVWKTMAGHCRSLHFGLEQKATDKYNVTAKKINVNDRGSRFDLQIEDKSISVNFPLPGRHNIMNALAAAACAKALNIPLEKTRDGLESLRGVPGRLQFKSGIHNLQLIDDTYNANPGSLLAGLNVLINSSGRPWLVLGDMGELGKDADELHEKAGKQAKLAGVERLFTVGQLCEKSAGKFGAGAEHFFDHEALIKKLKIIIKNELDTDITLLIKGSRAAKMESVVQALQISGESNASTIS
ncbi:MAG: UDP-N-acetylmuramoyl-tripeptide--D-alanyl-D-alanine ligase [Gammaproteobacteria bacterium]